MSVSYCIVLYLATYKALLSARAFQKRAQCEQPREKRQDFSLEKDEERLPERMVERTGGGSSFHTERETYAGKGSGMSHGGADAGNKKVKPTRGSKRTLQSGS